MYANNYNYRNNIIIVLQESRGGCGETGRHHHLTASTEIVTVGKSAISTLNRHKTAFRKLPNVNYGFKQLYNYVGRLAIIFRPPPAIRRHRRRRQTRSARFSICSDRAEMWTFGSCRLNGFP